MSDNRAEPPSKPLEIEEGAAPPSEESDGESQRRVALHLPVSTIWKVFAALLIAWTLYLLRSLLLLTFLAVLLAVTLESGIGWLQKKGLKRWIAATLIVGSFLGILGTFLALILPALGNQIGDIGESLPALRDEFLSRFPEKSFFRENLEQLLRIEGPEVESVYKHLKSLGGFALGGIGQCILLLVIAFYLLVDGRRVCEWVAAFFRPVTRRKLWQTGDEIIGVIFAYVMAQFITSLLVMIYCFIVLSALKVPAALLLALLAGLMDMLPILGFILALVPAFLFALGVSLNTAFAVFGFYVFYHAVEVYVLNEKVYGKQLRLSTLTILLGFLAGAILAGIPGALAALPIIASYPVIQKIWLTPYLHPGVQEKHEILKERDFGAPT